VAQRKSIIPPVTTSLLGDRILGAFYLVFFTPILLAVAVLIKCESSGPIFLKRHGCSANGDIIKVWEFRTVFTATQDRNALAVLPAKYTRLGNFLFETRLVLLPRLLNVLRGELPFGALFE